VRLVRYGSLGACANGPIHGRVRSVHRPLRAAGQGQREVGRGVDKWRDGARCPQELGRGATGSWSRRARESAEHGTVSWSHKPIDNTYILLPGSWRPPICGQLVPAGRGEGGKAHSGGCAWREPVRNRVPRGLTDAKRVQCTPTHPASCFALPSDVSERVVRVAGVDLDPKRGEGSWTECAPRRPVPVTPSTRGTRRSVRRGSGCGR
jgi:hypothetical protein